MEQRFLPAVIPATLAPHPFDPSQPGHFLDPRGKEAGLYYPAALFSAYHWHNTKASFPEAFIFGDSGGFSIATQGVEIRPKIVLEWQIQNTDIGCILDRPPFVGTGSKKLGGSAAESWKHALARTVEHTREALPTYLRAREEGCSFRWWGVVQGERPQQLEEWHQAIRDVYPFDDEGEGWTLKAHPAGDPRAVATVLRFARDARMTRIHCLQLTAAKGLLTLFALAQEAGLDFVSYDSSTASYAATRRSLIVPEDDFLHIRQRAETSRAGQTHMRDWMLTECGCASCGQFRKEVDAKAKNFSHDRLVQFRMGFHNFLTMLRFTRTAWEAAKGKDVREFLNAHMKKGQSSHVLGAFWPKEPTYAGANFDTARSVSVLDHI